MLMLRAAFKQGRLPLRSAVGHPIYDYLRHAVTTYATAPYIYKELFCLGLSIQTYADLRDYPGV